MSSRCTASHAIVCTNEAVVLQELLMMMTLVIVVVVVVVAMRVVNQPINHTHTHTHCARAYLSSTAFGLTPQEIIFLMTATLATMDDAQLVLHARIAVCTTVRPRPVVTDTVSFTRADWQQQQHHVAYHPLGECLRHFV